MASLLLSRGADVNSKTNGNLTPLQLATSEKEMLAVISVLVAEPHCDVTTKNGKSPPMLQLF
jgi:ankyrin repeat protein